MPPIRDPHQVIQGQAIHGQLITDRINFIRRDEYEPNVLIVGVEPQRLLPQTPVNPTGLPDPVNDLLIWLRTNAGLLRASWLVSAEPPVQLINNPAAVQPAQRQKVSRLLEIFGGGGAAPAPGPAMAPQTNAFYRQRLYLEFNQDPAAETIGKAAGTAGVAYAERVPQRYISLPAPGSAAPEDVPVPGMENMKIGLDKSVLENPTWVRQMLDLDDPKTRNAIATIAILDSGFDSSHPCLGSVVRKALNGYSSETGDRGGHGTAVAGAICAQSSNSLPRSPVGIFPGAVVQSYRVVEPTKTAGSGGVPTSAKRVAQALSQIWNNGSPTARVVNMSVGSLMPISNSEASDLKRLESAKVVVVASAGNESGGNLEVMCPALYSTVISVGAADHLGQRWPRSRYLQNTTMSNWPDYKTSNFVSLSAPGFNVYTSVPMQAGADHAFKASDGSNMLKAAYLKGTSFASPFVAAAAAYWLKKDLNKSAADCRNALIAALQPAKTGQVGLGPGLLSFKNL